MNPRSGVAMFGIAVAGLLVTSACAQEFKIGRKENVVVLGDSITADGRYAQIMQDLVDARFPERQVRILAHGASGDTVQRSLDRVEEDVVRWRPAWVLVNLGLNDESRYTTEEYLRHYEVLINRIYRDTGAKVGIVAPIYQDTEMERPRMEEYVAGLKELGRKYGALYVPTYEAMRDLRPALPKGVKYAVDGTHPNMLGYWMIAQTILQALDFPLEAKEGSVEIPARQVTESQSDELAGTSFTVALPMPLKVTLTDAPLGEVKVRKAGKAIEIDGKLEEWNTEEPIVLDKRRQQTCGVASWVRDHHRTVAYACYDEKGLYVAFVVDDSVVRHRPGAGIVERDCVELCLDLRTTEQRQAEKTFTYTRETKGVAQLILAPATEEVPDPNIDIGNGDKAIADASRMASSLTTGGYQIEVMIPVSVFPGGKIEPGLVIGFDFAVNNVDRFDRWSGLVQFRWSGSAWSFFSTREFGTMAFQP